MDNQKRYTRDNQKRYTREDQKRSKLSITRFKPRKLLLVQRENGKFYVPLEMEG